MKSLEEIRSIIEEEDVEFIRLQFTDMFGNLKNLAITPGQLERAADGEYFVEGSAVFDGLRDYGEDVFLKPDLNSFVILPWRPQQSRVAKIICDLCRSDGSALELSPRAILARNMEKCRGKGYKAVVDAACRFFLFHTDDNGMPTTVSHERAGYLDVGPMDLGENARREMVLNLEAMGFDIESSHHEKASAQHEIDFREEEAFETADAIVTFKFAVRSIAKRFGLHATFMPKPKAETSGSGMHMNIALCRDGKNLFRKEGGDYSREIRYFVGGILKYAGELCGITNPLVNSYKRLLAEFDAAGMYAWCDKRANPLVAVHQHFGDTKVEVRFPDSSADPYLTLAVCILAGIRGIEDQVDPDAVLKSRREEGGQFPGNLKEAIEKMRHSAFLREVLGDEFVDIYAEIKEQEWGEYMLRVSDWEVDKYLLRM